MIHIEGKVVDIMPETSGVGKSGRQWRERAAVINHVAHEQYPKNVVVAFKGEARGIAEAKPQIARYIRGMPGAVKLRDGIIRATTLSEVEEKLGALLD